MAGKNRRARTVGVEIRGSGPKALLAATILQAIMDVQSGGWEGAEAQEWLSSSGCRYCCDVLDIPHTRFLSVLPTRRLKRGTSTRAYWEDTATKAA
jgi:hypothetical protein